MRAFVESSTPREVPTRVDLRVEAPEAAAAPMAAAPVAAAPAAAAAAAPALSFVATVSHDGPWELRSLVVNDFQILDTTIATSERRIDVPIPPVLAPPLGVAWSILAGHLIPTVAAFMVAGGGSPVLLAKKSPLKKGESFAPLVPFPFP
jgi:hypothetical protein